MKILIVEDNQERVNFFIKEFGLENVFITSKSKQAIFWLWDEIFDIIFLDHDLGFDCEKRIKTNSVFLPSGEGTGYEVAENILQSKSKNAQIIIHSWNPAGAQNMLNILPNAKWYMFGTLDFVQNINLIKEVFKNVK